VDEKPFGKIEIPHSDFNTISPGVQNFRLKNFPKATDRQWNSWRWQIQTSFTNFKKLKENYEEVVEYFAVSGEMLDACKKVVLDSWRALNCLDGGKVDVKIDRNAEMNFIEVNPLAGLNPVTSDLPILCGLNGISYQEIIDEILKSAIQRIQAR